jgi:hypothetical protein
LAQTILEGREFKWVFFSNEGWHPLLGYIAKENIKNILLQNHWANFNQI